MFNLYLAPIRGITDSIMRSALQRHFGGLDKAVAPFVRPGKDTPTSGAFRDLEPAKNQAMPVVPQILTANPSHFIATASQLAEMGYTEVNWNLGCPFRAVVKKSQGAGLLACPEAVIDFLEKVIPKVSQTLSLKTRLGLNEPTDLQKILPRLNDYPIAEIIIHPRTALQMYEGNIHLDRFAEAVKLSRLPVVYNGDITNLAETQNLLQKFPTISGVMIGRGVLSDPLLPMEIKTGQRLQGAELCKQVSLFHEDILSQYGQKLSGPAHLLDKMKAIWGYLGHSIEADRKFYKRLRKANRLVDYELLIKETLSKQR